MIRLYYIIKKKIEDGLRFLKNSYPIPLVYTEDIKQVYFY
jgi:transposase